MLKSINAYLLCLFFCAGASSLAAQTYYTTNYGAHDGLPSNNVTCFCQSLQGYLWIGTNNGIAKWGQEFIVYNRDNGLPSNKITAIECVPNGSVWIGTEDGGLSHLSKDKFTNYGLKSGLADPHIKCLYFSAKANLLFVGTANGIAVFNGKKFATFNKNSNGCHVSCFMENDSSVLFGTLKQGVYYYHFTKKKTFALPTTSRLFEKTIYTWHKTPKGDTLISCGDRTLKILSKTHLSILKTEKRINAITSNNNGQVWIVAQSPDNQTHSSLNLLSNGKLVPFHQNLALPVQNISSVLYDEREGVLIIGSNQKGLFLWPGFLFDRFETPHDCGSLKDICEDSLGNVWLLGDKLIMLDKKQLSSTSSIDIADAITHFGPLTVNGPGNLGTNKNSVLVAHNNNILSIDPNKPTLAAQHKISCDTISYLSTTNKLLIIKDKGMLKLYDLPLQQLVKTVFFDRQIQSTVSIHQKLWVLDSDKKLWQLDLGRQTASCKKVEWPNLPTNITKISADKNGNLILVDDIGQLFWVETQSQQDVPEIKKINTPDTQGNNIFWILCDSNNKLWIGTDLGLSMVDLAQFLGTGTIDTKNWSKGEGYASTESFKAMETADGKIWVLSSDRVVRFDPKIIGQIERMPNLRLNSLSFSGKEKGKKAKEFAIDDILQTPTFGFENNSLVYSFDVSNLLNKEKVIYEYRLMPGNTEWSAPTKQSFVFLSNLQPGKYTIGVKAWFKHAPKNTAEMTLNFVIQQPWYQTVYAYVIYAVLIILLLIVLFEIRLKQIKKRESYKTATSEKIALLKMEALQAQMNPHFIFNALNTLQYNILENNTESSLEFLGEFSKLIRSTLDNASQHFISLREEIDYIENYMRVEQMRYSQKFYYSISLSNELDPKTVFIPPMIIQPHVENAIKYAFTSSIGYIIISISKVHDKLICMVEDNGIGRKQSLMQKKSHKSKGQSITSQRFEMLNKYYNKVNEYRYEIEDLYDEESNPSGTRVTLYFPLVTQPQDISDKSTEQHISN
jgi:hypothetical protein